MTLPIPETPSIRETLRMSETRRRLPTMSQPRSSHDHSATSSGTWIAMRCPPPRRISSTVVADRSVLSARARRVGAAHRRRCTSASGSRLSDYARERLGISARELQATVAAAAALDALPALAAAFEGGEVSWRHVRLLAAVAVPETDVAWVRVARGRSVRALERLVRNGSATSRYGRGSPRISVASPLQQKRRRSGVPSLRSSRSATERWTARSSSASACSVRGCARGGASSPSSRGAWPARRSAGGAPPRRSRPKGSPVRRCGVLGAVVGGCHRSGGEGPRFHGTVGGGRCEGARGEPSLTAVDAQTYLRVVRMVGRRDLHAGARDGARMRRGRARCLRGRRSDAPGPRRHAAARLADRPPAPAVLRSPALRCVRLRIVLAVRA